MTIKTTHNHTQKRQGAASHLREKAYRAAKTRPGWGEPPGQIIPWLRSQYRHAHMVESGVAEAGEASA